MKNTQKYVIIVDVPISLSYPYMQTLSYKETMENFKLYLEFQKDLAEAEIKVINLYLKGVKTKKDRRTSISEIVENVLRLAGQPLHISEIIKIAQRDFQTNLERDSVVSILIKKIKAGQKFQRTAPNTFTLIE